MVRFVLNFFKIFGFIFEIFQERDVHAARVVFGFGMHVVVWASAYALHVCARETAPGCSKKLAAVGHL